MASLAMSDSSLAHILQLMKKRTGDLVSKAEGKEILAETNMLLRNGLITDLLKNIRAEVQSLCIKKPPQAQQQAQAQQQWGGVPANPATDTSASAGAAPDLQSIRLKAEILFFTFYQTQVEADEARELLLLIKFLSDFVAQKQTHTQTPTQAQTQAQAQNPFGVGVGAMGMGMGMGAGGNLGMGMGMGGMGDPMGGVEGALDWQPPLFSLLVILQLAHVGAMQQTTYLLSRFEDYTQFQSVEELEVGNALPQAPGSRCGMEEGGGGSGLWLCEGARGFTCLAFAILRQPEVDLDQAPASDVEWFLHQACVTRAYSYIRLCMLPVLQAAYLQDRETSLFYVAVLCELLENLSKVAPMYLRPMTHDT
jgi:hypothetical protein